MYIYTYIAYTYRYIYLSQVNHGPRIYGVLPVSPPSILLLACTSACERVPIVSGDSGPH